MADYYVDPAAEGDNDGSSWDNAWTSIQTAFDTVTAGNTCYCRGTETTAAAIDVDTQTGTNDGGFIKFIGCNAAGAVDGTRFVINRNGGGSNVIATNATPKLIWFENIEVKNTGAGAYNGFNISGTSSLQGSVFINCCANNCGAHGWYGIDNATYSTFFRCVAYSNTQHGFTGAAAFNIRMLFCCARDNTLDGFYASAAGNMMIGCIAHGNSDDGIGAVAYGLIFNCVIDGNTDDGIEHSANTNTRHMAIIGCRITNHSGAGDIGLNANSEPTVTAHCYFEDNDGDNIQNATLHYNIPLENSSSTSNVEDQANTDEGYVDKGNHDFSTRYVSGSDPSLRRRGITIPWS